jgi:hypothetical protein
MGLDRVDHAQFAYAASQPAGAQPVNAMPAGEEAQSIALAEAPLALQAAVGGVVVLFGLMAVAPAFLKEREVETQNFASHGYQAKDRQKGVLLA